MNKEKTTDASLPRLSQNGHPVVPQELANGKPPVKQLTHPEHLENGLKALQTELQQLVSSCDQLLQPAQIDNREK